MWPAQVQGGARSDGRDAKDGSVSAGSILGHWHARPALSSPRPFSFALYLISSHTSKTRARRLSHATPLFHRPQLYFHRRLRIPICERVRPRRVRLRRRCKASSLRRGVCNQENHQYQHQSALHRHRLHWVLIDACFPQRILTKRCLREIKYFCYVSFSRPHRLTHTRQASPPLPRSQEREPDPPLTLALPHLYTQITCLYDMDIVFHPDGNFDEVYLYVRLTLSTVLSSGLHIALLPRRSLWRPIYTP